MVAPWQILADAAADQGEQLWRQQLLYAVPAIAASLLLAALVIAWVKSWTKNQDKAGLSAGDQLNQFRSMYEKGELSREEFDRVRGLLTARMKNEAAPPEQPPPAPSGVQQPPPDDAIKIDDAGKPS